MYDIVMLETMRIVSSMLQEQVEATEKLLQDVKAAKEMIEELDRRVTSLESVE